MPYIDYVVGVFDGAKFLTKIVLKSGYDRVTIFEANVSNTATWTKKGLKVL